MCGKSFSETAIKKGYLKIHIQVVHEKRKPFKCTQCDSCFGIRKSLKKHVLAVHDKVKPHKCPLCDSRFFNKTNLKNHIACVHDEERPFKCHICPLSFKQKAPLKSHIESVHEKRKPFECTICKKSFSRNTELRKHISSVHEKIKPHQCSICDSSFSEAAKLRLHIATVHEGKKSFECSICQSSFAQKGSLKTHIESVHEGKKPFSCSKCEKSFSRNRELKNHILAIHEGTPFQCSICDKNFSGNSELKRHTLAIHEDKKIIENSNDKNHSSVKMEAESDGNGSTVEEGEGYPMSFLEIKQENLNESDHNFSQDLENHEPFECPKIIKEEAIAESSEDFGIWSYDNEDQYDPSVQNIKTEEQQGNVLNEFETYDQTENSDPLEDNFQIDDFYDDLVVEEFLDENITDGFDDTEYDQKADQDYKHPSDQVYACPFCKKFKTGEKRELVKHIDGFHDGKKPFQCQQCNVSFKGRSGLRSHVLSVHEGIVYKCLLCDNIVKKAKKNLMMHIKTTHDIPEPKITIHYITEKSEIVSDPQDPRNLDIDPLVDKNSLVENSQIKQETLDYNVTPSGHEKKKGFKCSLCEYTSIRRYEMKMHNSTVHEGKKLYKCPHCGDSFKNRHGLKSHVLSIHEGIVYKCLLCENVIRKAKKNLIKHIKTIHEILEPKINTHFITEKSESMPEPHNSEGESNNVKGTNPKICDHCGSCFPSTSQLKRHIDWVHEGKIHKHQCYICGKSVKHLQEHISAVHDKLKPFICSICGYSCAKNSYLDKHMEFVHSDSKVRPFKCLKCTSSFKDERYLKQHVTMAHERLSGMLGKQLGCPFCSVISTTNRSLLDHVELEHPNWIDSFNNKLSLIRHVQNQSSNSQDIKDTTENKQSSLEKSENFVNKEVKNQDYTDRKSFKTKRGLTVITLSLEEKVKLIEDSKKPGFCRKEVVAKYGININTITNILKKQDKILKIVESGQRQVIPRVRLSLQEKAKLIEESKQPGFNKKEMAARYGINLLTVSNILSNQDKILKMIESGIGHKTNANFGKEKHASNSDKMSYEYKNSLHHSTINKPSL